MKTTKTELAAILGRSVKTLTVWQNEGMPYDTPTALGGPNSYNTQAVIAWLIRRETKQGLDLDVERAQLAREQTEIARHKNRMLAGETIPLKDAIRIAQTFVFAVRQKIVTSHLSTDEKNGILADLRAMANVDFTTIAAQMDDDDDTPDSKAG